MKRQLIALVVGVLLVMTLIPQAVGGEVHDPTSWHPPMLYHDHGAAPTSAHPALQEAMDQYWTQEIGSAWESSMMENAFPDGMHAAFTNLEEQGLGCEQLRGSGDDLCIQAYFLQVHAAGTNAHGRVDTHSYKAALYVCDQEGINCGTVITGGLHDYGFQHAPYKNFLCEQEGDPLVPPKYQFQTPYVGLAVEHPNKGQNRIFWNSLGPNAILFGAFEAARGEVPNRGLQLAWSEADAWDYSQEFGPACNDSSQDVRRCEDDDAACSDDGNLFQVFTIRMQLPAARPFVGWTDHRGVVVTDCLAEGPDCVPLIITAGVPQGRAYLNRPVGPDYAPLQDFDDGTPQRRPPFGLD